MSNAEQFESGVDAGISSKSQQLDYQQLFAGGNADYFAAKSKGNGAGSGDGFELQAVQFVEQSQSDGSKEAALQKQANDLFANQLIEPLQPVLAWKIDVADTPGGGKHMRIKGLGEGDLVKQADGSYKGELKDAIGKTPVEIGVDGTVKVHVDGEDKSIKLKADGTVDSVTTTGDAFYERIDRADGSGEHRFKDGSPSYTFQKNADGSEDRKYTDGSTEHASEGGSTRKYPNGSTRDILADGTTVYTDAVSGVVVRATPDQITTISYKDGTKITQLPNGTTMTRDPDGTTRTRNALGDQENTRLPDGTVVRTQHNPNGQIRVEVMPPGQKPPTPRVTPRAPQPQPPGDGAGVLADPKGKSH